MKAISKILLTLLYILVLQSNNFAQTTKLNIKIDDKIETI